MPFRRRVWTAGKVLLLVGALAATYVLSAAVSMRYALRAREVQVPNLISRTANEATALAGDRGLTVNVDEARRLDPTIPAGHVISQDPPAGGTTRRQRSVHVWLSAGPRATVVPALLDQTERSARLRLTQDGFEVVSVSEIRSDAYAADVVVAQEPPENAAGVQVALLVNRAEESAGYVMPDLIGVNGERAATILREHGFRVAVVSSTPYPGVPPGIVLRQSPQAGFQIGSGGPISIEVSR
jgi:serine/threonine-protein kinase